MILSYVALAESVSLLFFAGISLVLDHRSRLNRAYSLLALASALWAFAYTGVYAATDESLAWFWYRLSAVGWCLSIPATLLFTLTFTNGLEKKGVKILIAATFAYACTLLAAQLDGTLFVKDFIRTPIGNAEVIDLRSPGYYLVLIPMFAAVCWTAIAFFRSVSRQSSPKRRRLTSYMLACLMLTVPAGIIANLIMGAFLSQPIPAMGVFSLFFLLGGALPIVARFHSVSPLILRGLVADAIEDEVIIIGADAEQGLESHVVVDSLQGRFVRPDIVTDAVRKAVARKGPVNLVADVIEEGGERRAGVRVSPIFGEGEYQGCIVMVKAPFAFLERAEDFALSAQERRLVVLTIEGLSTKEIADRMGLSPGTVRNYTSNVFQKTGARGRSDLIRLFLSGA